LNFFISYEFVNIPADVPSNTLIVGAGSFLETQENSRITSRKRTFFNKERYFIKVYLLFDVITFY
jgi:hypothetical protein